MSEFLKKMKAKSDDLFGAPPVTVAFLGDSVTQGCFDIYRTGEASLETEFDSASAYSADFKAIFASLYPRVPLNIINCGISGGSAPNGLQRLERDVLPAHPDLVVVCFGLNDSGAGLEKIGDYTEALQAIFARLKQENIEVIFMTPNRMCTYVDCRMTDPFLRKVAEGIAQVQNDGVLDAYIQAARETAAQENVPVCDAYAAWCAMAEAGVDTTFMLANHVNHPIKELHWLFAWALVRTLFEQR